MAAAGYTIHKRDQVRKHLIPFPVSSIVYKAACICCAILLTKDYVVRKRLENMEQAYGIVKKPVC